MKPPQHSIDAEPVLILRDDPAWDFERIADELKASEGDHAIEQYFSGATRYDTTAIREYLTGDDQPTEFKLARLPVDKLARVQDMFAREVTSEGPSSLHSVWVEAVTFGLLGMSGPGAIDLIRTRGKLASDSLQDLHDECGGLSAIAEIGAAVFNLSQPLTAAEKKRSGS